MNKLLSCRFNMDTNRVEARFVDGSILAIDCIAVEEEYGDTPAQRAELDWLLYNKPLEYAQLVLARGFLLLYYRGLSHPPFWRVFLFCLHCLFRFRGVVRYALRVEQVLDLAAQRLCHLPKLVHVRAFTLSAAPAFHCAVAHARPAAKFPAAYPCGLAALVYGVIGVCFSHAAVLLLHKYTANAVKMEV